MVACMVERFILDQKANILFINFAGLRIESREQIDEFARRVREAYETQGRRLYGIVNYEGTEIAPEIFDYYGELIKELQDRYAITTVRYSSSGFTRSMLRYVGAAKDVESNTFATRDEAIRAIQEMESRNRDAGTGSRWALLDPRRSVLGKIALGWIALVLLLFVVSFFGVEQRFEVGLNSARVAALVLLVAGAITSAILYSAVVKPIRRMEEGARTLAAGGGFDPVDWRADDEVGRLARSLNEAAGKLRRDIDRLSGLYHISLMMGTSASVGKVCELLTRKIARLLGAQMCVILLSDAGEKRLIAQPAAYGANDEKLGRMHCSLDEKTVATWVFRTGEPYVTNDAAEDNIVRGEATTLGVKTLLAVPLQAGERTLGTLEVMNKEGGFIEEDKRLVTIFASQAAQLLANAQLFEQLIVSERMAVVGELIAGVAHEVRNPLFGITTTLSALARRLEDSEAVRPFLDVVQTEVDHLNHLMEQLLEHSRPVKLDAASVDMRSVIEEVLGEFRAQAREKDITIAVNCPDGLPRLTLDRRKIYGVFANLLENALQHTAAGGQVNVAAETSGGSPGNLIPALKINFSDSGAGIVPENLSRVFEPFFTTRATGTGLGLAIVRKTIHDHGGTITVRSEPGKGTTFAIDLPVSEE
jgi:signal transduction histidine kinase